MSTPLKKVWDRDEIDAETYRSGRMVTSNSWEPKHAKLLDDFVEKNFDSNKQSPSNPVKESIMSDPITRDELTAKLETIEAKADARFKEIMGEIKTSNATIAGKVDLAAARSAGKWTVWGAAGSIIVAMVATIIVLLQVMQTGYDSGRNAEKDLNDAATRVAAQRQSTEAVNARP